MYVVSTVAGTSPVSGYSLAIIPSPSNAAAESAMPPQRCSSMTRKATNSPAPDPAQSAMRAAPFPVR